MRGEQLDDSARTDEARINHRHQERALDRSRLGTLTSLTIITIVLATTVAVMIPQLRDRLPRIEGLNYGTVQFGLISIMVVFALYTFERERRLRRLHRRLMSERISAASMAARLDTLQEVATERDTVNALLLASADGILVVDKNRSIERMNPAMEGIIGRNAEETLGSKCEEVFGCSRDGVLACGTCPFSQVFAGGRPVIDHAFEAGRADGQKVWVSGAYAPVRGADGKMVSAIGSVRDVTKGKEVEALQQDFVSIVSHEVRGPLTAIKGFVKTLLLKNDRLTAETRFDFLRTIDEQAERLNQLVEDLLNVSRIESRRLRMRFEQMDLEASVHKLLNQFRLKWDDKEIVIDADPTLPLVVADVPKIEEVLINLIDNAVKYSPNGGAVKVSMHRME
ncbi:MAG: histidine kinase dimerization/phospho-acceptor domain-containing protein, partial [Acidimicrobiia bacterium]